MDEGRILQTLRLQAWERAKGEINAMLQTYYSNYEVYLAIETEVKKAVELIEEVVG